MSKIQLMENIDIDMALQIIEKVIKMVAKVKNNFYLTNKIVQGKSEINVNSENFFSYKKSFQTIPRTRPQEMVFPR